MHTSTASASASPPRQRLTSDPNIRWLMTGAFITHLGDQFTLLALPWAVLQMTADPLVLGLVLALVGVPRAAFILLGGALVDRHSPPRVLQMSRWANAGLLALLAAATASGALTLPLLYALALGLGVASAFAIPAATSMLPMVVGAQGLPAANGLMMGLRQLSLFIGPVLAGLLVAWAGVGPAGPAGAAGGASPGLGLAFAMDALSFVLAAATLTRVRLAPRTPGATPARPVLAAVAEGLRAVWADHALRAFLGYGALVSLLVAGPVTIALPLLANRTPTLGAAALGSMMGAHGAGTLLGLALAGARPHWGARRLGLLVLGCDATVALLFMPMGLVTQAWHGWAMLSVIGLLTGFVQVRVFTWLQQRVAPALMGRTMALFMFIFVGLAPLSAAATGALLRWLPLAGFFVGAGALLLALVTFAWLLPGGRLRRLAAPATA